MSPLHFAQSCCLPEKAVCSLACAMLLSCYMCPVYTLLSFSAGRMVSFVQAGYRGVGVHDMWHSKVVGALPQKKSVLFGFLFSLEGLVDAQPTGCQAFPG